MPRKAKRTKAQMSQRVKQNQTVKINIKNLLPPSGDYIQPRRGMPRDNLNMGNVSRLDAPSMRYAVRPPEFLPLPERINSQGQPQYFTQGVPRQGRPDLIGVETNPSDIAPSKAPRVAVAPQPIPKVERPVQSRAPAAVYNEYYARARAAVDGPRVEPAMASPNRAPMRLYLSMVDSPQMDEAQNLVAQSAGPLSSSLPQSASAAVSGSPPIPSSGFREQAPAMMASPTYPGGIEPRINPERMGQIYGTPPKGVPSKTIKSSEEKGGVSSSSLAALRRPPPPRTIEDDDEE